MVLHDFGFCAALVQNTPNLFSICSLHRVLGVPLLHVCPYGTHSDPSLHHLSLPILTSLPPYFIFRLPIFFGVSLVRVPFSYLSVSDPVFSCDTYQTSLHLSLSDLQFFILQIGQVP